MFDFDMLGLAPELHKNLKKNNFSEPTPIQAKAIPLALEGHDIMGLAQTGTGKTLAFALPLVNALLEQQGKPEPKTAKALILAPTRELVKQIADSIRPLIAGSKLQITNVIGGQPIGKQIKAMQRGADILVATPGRLIDLMDRKAVDLSQTRNLVLDEADHMLDLGFINALRKIEPALGKPRQTMLFSATMPKSMEDLSKKYLTDPQRVQVAAPGKAADKITQSVHFLDKGAKPTKLREMLDKDALTLVFSRTKHGAERLMKGLVADGYKAASIHGNKSQGQRDRAIKQFKSGEVTVLVATDVAARGIDIPGVAYVVNYDLPEAPDNYVHRIGRTARAGREGEAFAFCSPEEEGQLKQIEKLMGIEIPVASGTATGQPQKKKPARRGGPRKHQSRGKGGALSGAGNGGQGKPANANANSRRRPRRRKAA